MKEKSKNIQGNIKEEIKFNIFYVTLANPNKGISCKINNLSSLTVESKWFKKKKKAKLFTLSTTGILK